MYQKLLVFQHATHLCRTCCTSIFDQEVAGVPYALKEVLTLGIGTDMVITCLLTNASEYVEWISLEMVTFPMEATLLNVFL